jgi:hypothetical protein
MTHITYQTEKRINQIKKISIHNRTMEESLAVWIWDDIFASCSYLGATLKEFEKYLGYKLDNSRQQRTLKHYENEGIYGLEYKTNGNVRYVGTNDLSYVNITDFNSWIKSIVK